MSAYKGPQSLQTVLAALFRDLGIQGRMDHARTIEGWAALAGPQINALTEKAWIRGDRLYIKITSAAWRHELHLQRRAWRDRLNEQLGAELVRDIVFC